MNESELKVVKRYAMKQINLITAILLIHSLFLYRKYNKFNKNMKIYILQFPFV